MFRITNILIIGLLAFVMNCTQLASALGVGAEEESQDDQLLAAAVLLALQSDDDDCACQIGNQCFVPSSGINCAGGSATGTGTLVANTSSGEFVSLSVNITLTATSGTVDFNTGVSGDVSSKNTGVTVNNGTHRYFGNSGATDAAFTGNATSASTTSAVNYCLEAHLAEGHVIIRSGGCPSTIPADGTVAPAEENTSIGADTGRSWGFILNNATIDSVSPNSSEQFAG